MSTKVTYAAYRNGVKICESVRTFNGHVTEEFAKEEIAKAHHVSPDDVVIIEMEYIYLNP